MYNYTSLFTGNRNVNRDKKIVRIVFPNNSGVALITYLCAPIFTIITVCFIGNIMSKKVPKLYKILVGGR